MKKNTAKLILLSAVLAFSIAFQLVSCGASNPRTSRTGVETVLQTDGVLSVLLNSKATKITVKCALSKTFIDENPKATIYLYELPAGSLPDNPTLSSLSPVASYRASEKYSWSDTLGADGTRLYSSFILAKKNGDGTIEPIGSPVPILNPEQYAANTAHFPQAVSIKGLVVDSGSVNDALSLGVSHAVIDIKIEDFIAIPSPSDPSSYRTEKSLFGGVTYHFSPDAIDSLDSTVRALSDEGVIVYFRILLGTHPKKLPEKLRCIGFTDAPDAEFYALNIADPDGAGYIISLLEFLARRYTSLDRQHGFCGAFIIGTDVNRASLYNAVPQNLDAEEYAEIYERLVRVAHTALISNYASGRVYISLSNNWNENPESAGVYKCDSSASSFLATFAARSASCGDYNWGIAASAYALDRKDSSIWDDPLATGASSQFISPANISVLTYALSKSYTFEGAMRNVIVSSFDVHGESDDGASQSAQAASYAYAYYKVASDSDVDALIYNTLEDKPGATDNAPHFGLRSGSEKDSAKTIYNVFRTIDTQSDASVGNSGSVAGSEFGYLYNSLSSSVKVRKLFTHTGRTATSDDKFNANMLFNFTVGSQHDFRPASSDTGLDLAFTAGFPSLRVYGAGESGIVRTNLPVSQLRDSSYLLLDISGSETAGHMVLRISQSGKNGYITYEGTATYAAGEHTIVFDISEFSAAASGENVNLSLWFIPSQADTQVVLTIESLRTAAKSTPAPQILWIIFIALSLIFGLMMLIAVFTRAVHKIKRRHARRGAKPGQSGGSSSSGGIVPTGGSGQ